MLRERFCVLCERESVYSLRENPSGFAAPPLGRSFGCTQCENQNYIDKRCVQCHVGGIQTQMSHIHMVFGVFLVLTNTDYTYSYGFLGFFGFASPWTKFHGCTQWSLFSF